MIGFVVALQTDVPEVPKDKGGSSMQFPQGGELFAAIVLVGGIAMIWGSMAIGLLSLLF